MTNRIKQIMSVLVFTATLPMSVAADAQNEGKIARVDIEGIDISTPKGMEIVETKIRRAARSVCGPTDSRNAGSLANAIKNKACFEQAVADALFSLEERRMTAQYKIR